MASCAAAAVISAADKRYTLASELAAQIGVEHKAHADNAQSLTTANEVLPVQGDVIFILGIYRSSAYTGSPKNWHLFVPLTVSLCLTNSLGGDLEKALKSAWESFKLTNKSRFGQWLQLYQTRQQAHKPFFRPTTPLQPQRRLRSEQGKGSEAVFKPVRVSQT